VPPMPVPPDAHPSHLAGDRVSCSFMEAEFVQWLTQRLGQQGDVTVGIGDDAAVYPPGVDLKQHPAQQVVTTDLLCEGVHFVSTETSRRAIGRKALAVNLSDMAAMAARPRAAVVALLWPRDEPWSAAQELYEGLIALADQYQVTIAGGDTNSWQGPLVINVTLFGDALDHGVLRRNGAQVGDAIVVTGRLGGSLAGHHLRFEPRVKEAQRLHQRYELHAGMDLSDGLLLDLSRLTEASGVGAELDLSAIPISEAAVQLSRSGGTSALQHALEDGEDFELLLVVPPEVAESLLADQPIDCGVTRIGSVIQRRGLWQRGAQGQQTALPVRGYLH
jgi:thiamine-monophosphate kinase